LNVGSDDARFDFKKNLETACGRSIPWDEVDVDRRVYCGRLMEKVRPFPAVLRLIREARRLAFDRPDLLRRPRAIRGLGYILSRLEAARDGEAWGE
jgi:hypothetical protein